MDKRRAILIVLVHLVWATGLCFVANYLEYGVINIFMQWGATAVAIANVVLGILVFGAFYLLEKKLAAQEMTKPILFIFTTYFLPFAYQWMMLVQAKDMFSETDSQGKGFMILCIFTCLYLGVSLFMRAMTAFFLFAKAKLSENKPLL